jgi:hypothetical protein
MGYARRLNAISHPGRVELQKLPVESERGQAMSEQERKLQELEARNQRLVAQITLNHIFKLSVGVA